MNPISISQTEDLIRQEKALIIYFYNDNCAPCINLRPKVKEMAEKQFPLMKLVFVNSALHPEIAAQFGIFSSPALLVYFEGKEYHRLSKYVSISQLEELIERPYSLLFE